jgi:hypothetical protein
MTAAPFTPKKAARANGSDHETLSTFTGTKLDWLKCVAFDRKVLAYDFRVAFVIAQHLNLRTGSAMLSDETIAAESGGGSTRHVKRARVRLRKAGWLTWHNTSTANVYRPDYGRMNHVLDAMILAREARREKRVQADANKLRRPGTLTCGVICCGSCSQRCLVHEALRSTPAMALGIAGHVWSIGELLDAALATQPIAPTPTAPDRRRLFRVIQGGERS